MKNYQKIDPYDFNSIPNIHGRIIALWEVGELIDERIRGKYEIMTYSLHDFFVEVWINTKRAEVEKIFALITDKDWSGYLQTINLQDFLN